jgi:hypothetical protein
LELVGSKKLGPAPAPLGAGSVDLSSLVRFGDVVPEVGLVAPWSGAAFQGFADGHGVLSAVVGREPKAEGDASSEPLEPGTSRLLGMFEMLGRWLLHMFFVLADASEPMGAKLGEMPWDVVLSFIPFGIA